MVDRGERADDDRSDSDGPYEAYPFDMPEAEPEDSEARAPTGGLRPRRPPTVNVSLPYPFGD